MEEKKNGKYDWVFFWKDSDGFSARDFLLVTTMGAFSALFCFCIYSLIRFQNIPDDAFLLFDSTESVLITVVGGTMGVIGVEKVMDGRSKTKKTETYETESTESSTSKSSYSSMDPNDEI